jgi:hypothetical protein
MVCALHLNLLNLGIATQHDNSLEEAMRTKSMQLESKMGIPNNTSTSRKGEPHVKCSEVTVSLLQLVPTFTVPNQMREGKPMLSMFEPKRNNR